MCVSNQRSKKIMQISSRESFLISFIEIEESGRACVVFCDEENEANEVQPKHVYMTGKGGIFFTPHPDDPNQSTAEFLMSGDAAGNIPVMVQNLVIGEQSKVLCNIKDQIGAWVEANKELLDSNPPSVQQTKPSL